MRNKEKKISRQDGIITGNIENKEEVRNPVAKFLVKQFDATFFRLLEISNPISIHSVGCGEGRLVKKINKLYNVPIRGTDLSKDLINNLKKIYTEGVVFESKNIYDLNPEEDYADVIVCCEVLEHLEYPDKGLRALKNINARSYIFSVPREPVWRVLNVMRGKYVSDLGNTPGHLNHWSKKGFLNFLKDNGFEVHDCKSPLPWTMVKGRFKTSPA